MTTLILKKKKNIFYKLKGFNAAEAFHFYLYGKEIFELLQNSKKIKTERLYKYIIFINLLSFFKKKVSICEIGSSLFELIARLEHIKKLKKIKINFKNIKFLSLEKSCLYKFYQRKIFPEYEIKNYNINDNFKADILFDRAVSNYIFREESKLAKFYSKFKICYVNLLTVKNTKKKVTGEFDFSNLMIFNLQKLEKHLKKYNLKIFYLFGKKNPNIRKLNIKTFKNNLHLDAFFIITSERISKKIEDKIINKFELKLLPVHQLNKSMFYKIR
jgi:hypothetical protein